MCFPSVVLSFESYSFLIGFSAGLHEFHFFLDLFILLRLDRSALIILRLTLSLLALLLIFLLFQPIQCFLLFSQSSVYNVHLCFMGPSLCVLALSLSILLCLGRLAFSFAGTFPLLLLVLFASGDFTSLSLLLELGYLLCFGLFLSLFTVLLLTVVVIVVLTGSLCRWYTSLIYIARLWCQCCDWTTSSTLNSILDLLESGHILGIGRWLGPWLWEVSWCRRLSLCSGCVSRCSSSWLIFRCLVDVLPMKHRVAEFILHHRDRKIRLDTILNQWKLQYGVDRRSSTGHYHQTVRDEFLKTLAKA